MKTIEELANKKLFPELENRNDIKITKIKENPWNCLMSYYRIEDKIENRANKGINLYILDRKLVDGDLQYLKKFFNKIKPKREDYIILTNNPSKVIEIRKESGNNNTHIVGFSLTAGHKIAENYIQKLLNK